jgi:hypothetical protein
MFEAACLVGRDQRGLSHERCSHLCGMGCRIACTVGTARCLLRRNADQGRTGLCVLSRLRSERRP